MSPPDTLPQVPSAPSQGDAPPRGGAPGPGTLWGRIEALPVARRLGALHRVITGGTLFCLVVAWVACTAAHHFLEARRVAETVAAAFAHSVQADLQRGLAISLHSAPEARGLRGVAFYDGSGRIRSKLEFSPADLPDTIAPTTEVGGRQGLFIQQHFSPVFKGDAKAGTVIVDFSLSPRWGDLALTLLMATSVAAGAALAGRVLYRRFSPLVTAPFAELSSIVGSIPAEGECDRRLPEPASPDLRRLVSRLNELLGRLDTQANKLEEATLDVELSVLTRTSELAQQVEDRKKAEIALRDSELRYRNLFENNPVPMFVMDLASLRFLAVNLAALRHYGYSGREFTELTLPALTDRNQAMNVPRVFRKEERSFDAGDWIHLRKNGERIDVQLTAHTIMFAGKVAKIVLANDVTTRNRAQRELDEANKKLLETSRRAGMAEVATGVLHNVGNVLNSVNVSAALIAQSIQGSKANNLRKVTKLLADNQGNLAEFFGPDGKGPSLATYLETLAAQLEADRALQCSELDLLSRNITHIKHIVAMQQNHAKVRGVLEPQSARELVEEALRMTASDLHGDHVPTSLHCAADVADVLTDRHKALQILVNVISNARQAMRETPANERMLTIRLEMNEAKDVSICLQDRGCGIASENLTRIFNHGFTTKKDGHGFGLHGAANTAKELNGGLAVMSDGPGFGTTVVVTLPSSFEQQKNVLPQSTDAS